ANPSFAGTRTALSRTGRKHFRQTEALPYSPCAIILDAMDVFISWSGERSRAAAETLREWLPMVINAVEPWLSSADIDKGSRWATDLSVRMEVSKAGIICLTPSNLRAEWILFEAGALSKTIKDTFVCPFLIDLKPTDLRGPLAQFQAVRATNKKEVWE